MPISLTGLGSFDSSGLITQLVNIAQQPISDLQTKKQSITSAVSTMNTFSSRLSTLRMNANTMAENSGYASFSTTSSDAAVVASASGTAQAGSYSVNVTSLAAIEKRRGSTEASSSTALNMAGTLNLKVGSGTAVDVTIAATDTLGDIAAKIAKSGARVAASVLYDGTSYRLSLQGSDTGAANALTVTENGLDLGLNAPGAVFQSATDAKLTIDGLAITRPTNSVSGAIPGVTLALTKPGVTSTVSIASDTSALKTKITGFVSAYNDIVNAGHSATGYSTIKATNAILQGETSIRRALDGFARIVGSAVPGTTGKYTTLGSVGMKLANDGTLSFDSSKFDTAVAADPDGVRKLFVTDPATGSTGVMKSLMTSIDALTTGASSPIKSRIAAFQARSTAIDTSVAEKQKRVDAYEIQLKKQYSQLDQIMSKYSSMSSAINSISNSSNG
ncbi:MAG: Flagellar hook-associated protein FliD [Labilithrix sp.]|nr:Flagellar hook-associated protein FliD [Labilithrix sp.]